MFGSEDSANEERGCYTLLADDNSAFSNTLDRINSFKAHLVFNVALNGRIAFSDNQVICSSNLQRLADEDPTIVALFEEGLFDLALRSGFNTGEGLASLRAVHEAFVLEQKIRFAATDFEGSRALARIERCARIVPWAYDAIRTNFTDTCERLLLREFRALLSDSEFERFRDIIAAEKLRDLGLGREFLQNRLPAQMRRAGIRVNRDRRDLLRRCTDAPYLSNLPSLIGLNPIYAEEHRTSFELMRGGGTTFETIGEVKAPSQFDYGHYVEGLCRLTLDDILFLQDLPSRKAYLDLSNGGLEDEAHYNEAVSAFVEFNLLVEDRIASRFPEIARHSPAMTDRTFYKQKAKSYARAGAEDLFSILIGLFCPVAPLAVCRQLILDMVPAGLQRAPRTAPVEQVERRIREQRLQDHLGNAGADARMRFEEKPEASSGFTKEIIIS